MTATLSRVLTDIKGMDRGNMALVAFNLAAAVLNFIVFAVNGSLVSLACGAFMVWLLVAIVIRSNRFCGGIMPLFNPLTVVWDYLGFLEEQAELIKEIQKNSVIDRPDRDYNDWSLKLLKVHLAHLRKIVQWDAHHKMVLDEALEKIMEKTASKVVEARED